VGERGKVANCQAAGVDKVRNLLCITALDLTYGDSLTYGEEAVAGDGSCWCIVLAIKDETSRDVLDSTWQFNGSRSTARSNSKVSGNSVTIRNGIGVPGSADGSRSAITPHKTLDVEDDGEDDVDVDVGGDVVGDDIFDVYSCQSCRYRAGYGYASISTQKSSAMKKEWSKGSLSIWLIEIDMEVILTAFCFRCVGAIGEMILEYGTLLSGAGVVTKFNYVV
jgi:hypothetical protein